MVVFFTDTDCDITPSLAKELGFQLISMPYSIEDKEVYPYEDFDKFEYKEYYDLLRSGVIPKTSAIPPTKYMEYFEPHFAAGNDIVYLHFSKNMSGTFNSMNIALEDLYEKYPDRKLIAIDTKGISALGYLIIKEVHKLIKENKPVEEIKAWVEENSDKYAIYFYADDLKFFGRSGRINNFSAVMGNILGLHPIIHINSDGYMLSIAKSKGKNQTLNKIIQMIDNIQEDIDKHPIVIGHTDIQDIAEKLGNMLKEKYGAHLDIEYIIVNPTAGAHCGPNCVGVAFHSKGR